MSVTVFREPADDYDMLRCFDAAVRYQGQVLGPESDADDQLIGSVRG